MAAETVHQLARTATGDLVPTPPHVEAADWAAFVAHIAVIPGGCHLWLGDLYGSGYGKLRTARPQSDLFGARELYDTMPHRHVVAAFIGAVPPDTQVMHECDEPLCAPVTADVYRRHLQLGDAGLNARERSARGRNGSRRHGVRRRGADTRDRYQRSLAMQIAVRTAMQLRIEPDGLRDVVAHVQAAGDVHPGQLSLLPGIPAPRLRVVR